MLLRKTSGRCVGCTFRVWKTHWTYEPGRCVGCPFRCVGCPFRIDWTYERPNMHIASTPSGKTPGRYKDARPIHGGGPWCFSGSLVVGDKRRPGKTPYAPPATISKTVAASRSRWQRGAVAVAASAGAVDSSNFFPSVPGKMQNHSLRRVSLTSLPWVTRTSRIPMRLCLT